MEQMLVCKKSLKEIETWHKNYEILKDDSQWVRYA